MQLTSQLKTDITTTIICWRHNWKAPLNRPRGFLSREWQVINAQLQKEKKKEQQGRRRSRRALWLLLLLQRSQVTSS